MNTSAEKPNTTSRKTKGVDQQAKKISDYIPPEQQKYQQLTFSPEIATQLSALGTLLHTDQVSLIQLAVNNYLNDVFEVLRDNFMKEVSTSKMNFTDDQAKRMAKFIEQNKMSQEEFMQCAVGYFIENHTTP